MVKKIIDGVEYELSDEEIATRNAEQESMKSIMARQERNILLSESDVYALADRITDEWRTYRQALRDVPLQAGFPDNISWPVKPT
tara:strand:+ start:209 stop:463 length:255 start_codon:yes stop_codon:yes gene_type:complete